MTGENPLQRVMALRARAEAAARQGLEDVVLELYGEAVAASRDGDDRRLMGHTIRHRGDALRRAGRLEEARQCYVEALELYGGAPETPPGEMANALRPMALLMEALGRADEARERWEEARLRYDAAGVEAGVEECRAALRRLASGPASSSKEAR